ncbi:MAG: hypothetical protein HY321_16095 [Armatimonadetes bacterium]|nr:hypothetical protein [Armatimonadota bacterium]
MRGEARTTDAPIAGDHVVATDACAATLLGHDRSADWPMPVGGQRRGRLAVGRSSPGG